MGLDHSKSTRSTGPHGATSLLCVQRVDTGLLERISTGRAVGMRFLSLLPRLLHAVAIYGLCKHDFLLLASLVTMHFASAIINLPFFTKAR
jgi:hypothetical protein